jgi:hypothetical protein
MSITTLSSRQEKKRWLMSRLDQAASVSILGGFGCGLMWLNGIELEYVAPLAIICNIVSYGLIVWQSKRLSDATRSVQ